MKLLTQGKYKKEVRREECVDLGLVYVRRHLTIVCEGHRPIMFSYFHYNIIFIQANYLTCIL